MDKNARVGHVAHVRYRGGASGEDPIDDCSVEPVDVVLGVGNLPKGMDDAFLAMEIGEERTIHIPCDLAYGQHDPEGVRTYPRTFMEKGMELQVGDVVSWVSPVTNETLPVRVIKADDQLVTLDFNHPFAGKDLRYWLMLESLD